MTAAPDTLTALLAELVVLGIQVVPLGDRLRCRPRRGLTPILIARINAHKSVLLALLTDANTETPAGAVVARGFGCGVGVGEPTTAGASAARNSVVEHQVLPRACGEPSGGVAWVSGAALAELPAGVAELAQARVGWTPAAWRFRLLQMAGRCAELRPERSDELRRAAIAMTPACSEEFKERAAIMEYDGGISGDDAESATAEDVVNLIPESEKPC